MKRRRNPGSLNRRKPEVANVQPGEPVGKAPDTGSADIVETANVFTNQVNGYECEDYTRGNKSSKCNKCKYNCETICCKYGDCDCCNFACASDKELLIRIICLLINKEYGLKAIEQKIRNSEENGDKKNIESITDLLERAIVGLGETAVGAVKKAVDAAGTMTDITYGLSKIASGAAGTAGSAALTTSSLASVAQGAAGTAGSAALTASGLAGVAAAGAATAGVAGDIAAETAGLAAAGAATVGVVGDIAAETAGLAAAGAATVGVAGDIAAETAGLAAAGAATVGVAGDIAAETAGLAAAGAATAGAAADILAEEAGAAAAISGTQASLADIVEGEAATAAAVSGTIASAAETVNGAAATSAAISGTVAGIAGTAAGAAQTAAGAAATSAAASGTVADIVETAAGAVTTGPVTAGADAGTVQVWVLNNNNEATGVIDIIMYNMTVTPKTGYYRNSSAVPARSSVFFTIASVPAAYEVQIRGLARNIIAYAVSLNGMKDSLNMQVPVEARILFMYP